MKKLFNNIKRIFKDILLGFQIAEDNRHLNGFGKF